MFSTLTVINVEVGSVELGLADDVSKIPSKTGVALCFTLSFLLLILGHLLLV